MLLGKSIIKSYLAFKTIYNELQMRGWDTFNAFLYNVIAVLILDAFKQVSVQFLDNLNLKILAGYTFNIPNLSSSYANVEINFTHFRTSFQHFLSK